MKTFLRRLRKKTSGKRGYTLLEVIVTVGILGIILAFASINVMRLVHQAYMTRANDTAKVVYMALQSSLSDMKTRGELEEKFTPAGRNHEYYTVPDIVIDGGTVEGITIPGVTDESGNPMSSDERKALRDSEDLVYMKLSPNGNEDSKLFRELIDPYISDKGIMNYTLIAEVNLNNKTVRSVFYTERTEEFRYFNPPDAGTLNKEALESEWNVLLRGLTELDDKNQGYYGITGVGAKESIQELENAYVRVLNDDMLTIEWGEIGPVPNGEVTEDKRKVFKDTTYDITIVNANDTSKVYYKLENVTAYKPKEAYAGQAGSTVSIGGELLRKGGNVRDPMPVYDLYAYETQGAGNGSGVERAFNRDLMVPCKTSELQPDGKMKVYDGSTAAKTFNHRLSYFVPSDIAGKKQYGVYRLVLDSMTSGEADDLSIRKKYPAIPWDENFKVIVTGKSKGEGFTGSMSTSSGEDNGYVDKKALNPAEDLYVHGVRGGTVLEEIQQYLVNKADNNSLKSNMWYEVAYARHLSNLRYIIGYEDPAGTDPAKQKNGRKQNVLLTKDIDWSLQQLGAETVKMGNMPDKTVHRLTVSNMEESQTTKLTDVTNTNSAGLRAFNPITADPGSGTAGYEGKFLSAAKKDKKGKLVYRKDKNGNEIRVGGELVPVFETFEIAYLRLADSSKETVDRNNHIGLFDKVDQTGHIRDITLRGVTAYGTNYVGGFAGEFEGCAERLTVVENERPNIHKRLQPYPLGGDTKNLQEEVVLSANELKPYQDSGNFVGNQITAVGDHAGGMFGLAGIGNRWSVPADGKSGVITDVTNGTRLVNLYEGPIAANVDQTQDPASRTNASLDELNGISVVARSYAGGLAGEAGVDVVLKKAANTGEVTARNAYAGGLAGALGARSQVAGAKAEAADVDGVYAKRVYQFKLGDVSHEKEYEAKAANYGKITAGNYAGGVFGIVAGAPVFDLDRTALRDLKNVGPVESKANFAGGIVGCVGEKDESNQTDRNMQLDILNTVNQAEVVAAGQYAGGIAGYVIGDTRIAGVQNLVVRSQKPMLSAVTGKNVAEIYAGGNAGGIAGYTGVTNTGTSSVSIEVYQMPYELDGQPQDAVIEVVNTVTIRARGDNAGGIAGEIQGGTRINPTVQNIGIRNISSQGPVTAENFAGGIAGQAGGDTVIRNAVNSSAINARSDYAGGLVGRISEKADLANDLVGIYVTNTAYTNTGKITARNYAGGIAGRAESEKIIWNVFNMGEVGTTRDYAGGIIGSIGGTQILDYETNLVVDRGTHTPDSRYTNNGRVTAGLNNAGGIAGILDSDRAYIRDVFNNGTITTTAGSNAGGLVGEISPNGNNTHIEYRADVLDRLVIPAAATANIFYMNSGNVRAQSNNAGGIAGSSDSTLLNVYNSGNVTAQVGSNAGGIAGEMTGVDGAPISVLYQKVYRDRMLAHAIQVGTGTGAANAIYTNRGAIQAGSTAGGVVGTAKNTIIQNTMNAGTVTATGNGATNGDVAGGIAGALSERSRIENDSDFAIALTNSGNPRQFNNRGAVKAQRDAAGGIAGSIDGKTQINNIFNGGLVNSTRESAGGIAGIMSVESRVTNDAALANDHVLPKQYFNNQSNVTADGLNAGGIAGKVEGTLGTRPEIRDVYSGTSTLDVVVIKAGNNAGGVAGLLRHAVINNNASVDKALDLGIYTNNTRVQAGQSNAGGIVGNADVTGRNHNSNNIANDIVMFNGITIGAGLTGNEFTVSDVYNTGTVTAGRNNAGGIFGVAGGGTYSNEGVNTEGLQPVKRVNIMLEKGMRTNAGTISAGSCNSGGIIGFASEKFNLSGTDQNPGSTNVPKDVADVFNSGTVMAANNAGGIAGKAIKLDLKYSTEILTGSVNADNKVNFIFANENRVVATQSNAGGIIGDANIVRLQDVFNSGVSGYGIAQNDLADKVTAGTDNAGGLVGRGRNLSISSSPLIQDLILEDRNYVYTNLANVRAGRNNAGGILGEGTGGVQLVDVYNSGRVVTSDTGTNAGGVVGHMLEAGGGTITDVNGNTGARALDGIDTAASAVIVQRQEPLRKADLAAGQAVSYITYQTITSVEGETDNRHSNSPKPSLVKAATGSRAVLEMVRTRDNAGGIVGYAEGQRANAIRIENVFNKGATHTAAGGQTREMLGVRALNNNAGGLIGRSAHTNLSYSFMINPGPGGNLDTTSKGDHSTFAPAFNEEAIRRDPYAVNATVGLITKPIGLHMVANSASVRAQRNNEVTNQTAAEGAVNYGTGRQATNMGSNAGGAIGSMTDGRIERVYSLKGSVTSPVNVGGVVGSADGNPFIKQVTRLDGEDILLPTTFVGPVVNPTLVNRGSYTVGGIVGRATGRTQIYDVRNFVKVQGRQRVGGIAGWADGTTEIVLAQNGAAVLGTGITREDVREELTPGGTGPMAPLHQSTLDRAREDGSYVGGITGRADVGMNITMVKNDPLITHDFNELQKTRGKWTHGGNRSQNPNNPNDPDDTIAMVSGKEYVGGITGHSGILNYAVNTGQVSGIRYLGGVSGQGYRITNSFNTGDVKGSNGSLYVDANNIGAVQAMQIGGISGQLGTNTTGTGTVVQTLQPGAYIQNVFNSSQVVSGASYVGGITGYAVAPINVSYNSAAVSSRQLESAGNKSGGLIGVMAQDRGVAIRISNSYSTGEIISTGDRGALVGYLEGYESQQIPGSRIQSSYFISDKDVTFFNGNTSQVGLEINYGLDPIYTTSSDPSNPNQVVEGTGELFEPDGVTPVTKSNIGLRKYTNMIRDINVAGGTTITGSGEADLKAPLNTAINADRPTRVTTVQNAANTLGGQRNRAAKFVFPYATLRPGTDYEFPHMDFTGTETDDQFGQANASRIGLGTYKAELPGNNQFFVSWDESQVTNMYNYWPTKAIDYMKPNVVYDNDGGNTDDNSIYTDGELVQGNTNRNRMDIEYRANGAGAAETVGNDMYPIKRNSDEIMTLEGTFNIRPTAGGQFENMPQFFTFNVYDGHSRGEYRYDNTSFRNIILPKGVVKSYTLIRKDVYESDSGGTGPPPAGIETVMVAGETYYFYAKDVNLSEDDPNGGMADLQWVDAEVRPYDAANGEMTIAIRLQSEEMQSYLGTSSGYFTMEASMVRDESDTSVGNGNHPYEVSRMFNMHFSNADINEPHNDSILDRNIVDFDNIVDLEYDVDDTAALGSTLLREVRPNEFEPAVENKLQIRNERHLYNINQGDTAGDADTKSSQPKYLSRDIELMNHIQLSTHNVNGNGYNGFVIGASNKKMYRFTGSFDGNGHTIGQMKVDRMRYPGFFDQNAPPNEGGPAVSQPAIPNNDYALFFDVSGGVVKDLYLGNDSTIIAARGAGLAYYVSNGRRPIGPDPYQDLTNPLFENLGPNLPMETGTDAKLYDVRVLAKINARETGGVAYRTARRFNSDADVRDPAVGQTQLAATFTRNTFGGIINARYANNVEPLMNIGAPSGNDLRTQSTNAAGILCFVSGDTRIDDIIDPGAVTRQAYPTEVGVNDSQVSEDGYVYANNFASGILGLARYTREQTVPTPQRGMIRKSRNNGAVVSREQASGISHGIIGTPTATGNLSSVEVTHSYNNGLVQTPENVGLASGIGNSVTRVSDCINNGSVFGRISSGITSYSDANTQVTRSANNGYVQAEQIAGGITAAPSEFAGAARVSRDIRVNISNCYNAGQVVVTTNVDNALPEENSYAGGITGYAAGRDRTLYTWKNNRIGAIPQEQKTRIQNSYNAGTVRYVDGYVEDGGLNSGNYSDNNRNIGGIAGGGLNQFVDIQNSYNLSDPRLQEGTGSTIEKLNIGELGGLGEPATTFVKQEVRFVPGAAEEYNYRLSAVGDTTYGDNVTSMSYEEMQSLEKFVGFDDTVWTIDATPTNGTVYPFPQFINAQAAPQYVEDQDIANVPDYKLNIRSNEENRGMNLTVSTDRITVPADFAAQTSVTSRISYDENASTYTIGIDNYSPTTNYKVRIYDGNANAAANAYAPILIRSYEIAAGGAVTGGGKLHNETSVTDREMEFFNPANVAFDARAGTLTIGNEEELGYYMPIRGYYTAVVTRDDRSGGLETTRKVSERFQIHFGGDNADGSNIEANTGADTRYTYNPGGGAQKAYKVTDQHSVIGLTTSGIAKGATDRRIYRQSNDITINEPFYSIFEFNGEYDGGGHTLTRADGDAGFITFLRSINTAQGAFEARVRRLTMNVRAVGSNEMDQIGKYLEAVNYVGNLGLIADYMEAATVADVTVEGQVQPTGYRALVMGANQNPAPYLNRGNGHAFAGIAAVVTNGSNITDSRNNAMLSVPLNNEKIEINIGNGQEIELEYQVPNALAVETAGIAGYVANSRLEKVSNNGRIHSSLGDHQASGLVHTMEGNAVLTDSMNGGWVGAHNSIAAGLVVNGTDSTFNHVYNSGKITGLAVNGGTGTAIGCIANITRGRGDQIYNAGMLSGRTRAALTRTRNHPAAFTNMFYLKDENLYWGDATALPHYPRDYIAADASEVELYLGFARNPTESFAFTDVTSNDYIVPPNPITGAPAGYDDPFAVTYRDFTETGTADSIDNDFDFANVWEIKDPLPENPTVDQTNALIRDYGQDYYPLPELRNNEHKTRDDLDFPLLLGEAQEIGRTPYRGEGDKAKYVPLGVADPNLQVPQNSETFLDTIAVDLQEMTTTSKYEVLINDGDSQMGDLNDKQNAALRVIVERKYLDLANLGNLTEITNPNNLQYSNITASELGAYYYEVLALAGDGTRRPAVFKNKAFINNKNEILLNNNILDRLPEPGNPAAPYYSATVVEYQIPGKPPTNPDHFYSKISPHFADATATQAEPWRFGGGAAPYAILSQRNLMNIGKGGAIRPPAVMPPASSHYLESAYSQVRDITMTDEKIQLANMADMEGTQPRLWNAASGIGTANLNFTGSYTARSRNTPDANGYLPRRIITDNRGELGRRAMFKSIGPNAVVSDINYVTPTNTTWKLAAGVNALIAQKSAGTIKNIELSGNTKVQVATMEPFGLIAGTIKSIDGVMPKLEQITVSEKMTVEASNNKPIIATVIGIIEDDAELTDVTSQAKLTNVHNEAGIMGGIVGKIGKSAAGGTENKLNVTLTNVTYDSLLTVSQSYKKTIGGIIGSAVGLKDASLLTLNKVISKKEIRLNNATSDGSLVTAGGLIGSVKSSNVAINDSAAEAGISRNSGSNADIGGIIGRLEEANKLAFTNVTAGTAGTSINLPGNDPISDSYGITRVGGIIGSTSADEAGGVIEMTGVQNFHSISITNARKGNKVGGLVGIADGYAIDIKDSENLGGANIIGTQYKNAGSEVLAGGIIGEIKNGGAVTMAGTISGTEIPQTGLTARGTASSAMKLDIGGIIGKAVTKAPSAMMLKDVTNNSNILGDQVTNSSNAGGIVGTMDGYAVNMDNTNNAGNVSVIGVTHTSTDTTNVGGLIGRSNGPQVTIKNSSATGTVAAEKVAQTMIGGIAGHLDNVNQMEMEKVNAGAAGAEITRKGSKAPVHLGGIVGMINSTKAGDPKINITNVYNHSTLNGEGMGNNSSAGGFIGTADTYAVEIQDSTNHSGGIINADNIMAGGIVGELRNGRELMMKNVTAGEVIPRTQLVVNLTGNSSEISNISGMIGKVSKDPAETKVLATDFSDVVNSSDVIASGVAANSRGGGMLGSIEGYQIDIKSSRSTGNVSVSGRTNVHGEGIADKLYAGGLIGSADIPDNAADVSITDSSATGGVSLLKLADNGTSSAGGIVGYLNGTDNLTITNVTAGTADVSNIIKAEGSESQNVNLGGIVGMTKANTETSKITMTNVRNYNSLIGEGMGTGHIAGGFIGLADSYELAVTAGGNFGGGNITAGKNNAGGVIAGGIVGELRNGREVTMENVTAGSAKTTLDVSSITGSNLGIKANIGGVIGKAGGNVPDTGAGRQMTLTNVDNFSAIKADKILSDSSTGGIIGNVTGYKIKMDSVDNTGNVAVTNQRSNAATTITSVGGLVGYMEKQILTIEGSSSRGGVSSTQGNGLITGGIAGYLDHTEQVTLKTVTSGIAGNVVNTSGDGKTDVHLGGIIGKAISNTERIDSTITLDAVENHNSLKGDDIGAGSTAGGMVGLVDGYVVNVSGSKNTQGGALTGGKGMSAGGVIGKVQNGHEITMNGVNVGTLDATGMNQTMISTTGDGQGATHLGGIIGQLKPIEKATPPPTPYKVTMTGVNSDNVLKAGAAGDDSTTGGIIGLSDEYEIDINTSTLKADINAIGTRVSVGGAIGEVKNGESVELTGVNCFSQSTSAESATGGTVHLGGIIGKTHMLKENMQGSLKLTSVSNTSNLAASGMGTESTAGGLLGSLTRYTLESSTSDNKGGITAAGTEASIGGAIGRAMDVKEIKFENIESGRFDPDDNTKSTAITATGKSMDEPMRVSIGGFLGAVIEDKITDAAVTLNGVINNSNQTLTNIADGSQAGGLIGKTAGYDVTIQGTQNRGNFAVKDFGDQSSINIGGLIAELNQSKVILKDTENSTPDSNLVNRGKIQVGIAVQDPGNTAYIPGVVRTAGAIGYMNESEADITGFRNEGEIAIAGENQDEHVYLAGVIAEAKGIYEYDPSVPNIPEEALIIRESLNAGKLVDNRKVLTPEEEAARPIPRNSGMSTAAGIAAVTDTVKGSESRGVVIEYNHNAGAVKAITAAGIVHSITKDGSIAKSNVVYNMNVGTIDVKDAQKGSNITSTWQLPVAEDADGNQYNGKGEPMVPPPPGDVPALTKHYNIALEDMIRPVQTPPSADEPLAVDSITLRLAELQDIISIYDKAGWGPAELSLTDGAGDVHDENSKWMISGESLTEDVREYMLPVIRTNAYVPDEATNYTEMAAYGIKIENNAEGYKLNWRYKDEIDEDVDGFSLIITTEDGEVKRILELEPGVATKDESTQIEDDYTYTMKPSQLSDITNEFTDIGNYKISVASIRDGNGRYARSLDTDIELLPTVDVEAETTEIKLVVKKPVTRAFNAGIGNSVVAYAISRLGDPYSMPLAGQEDYVDCSYLVQQAYRSVGINLPRTAAEQAKYCVDNKFTISKEELKPGDLIFYSFEPSGEFMSIGHVSIYVGNGMIIEASSTQGMVVINEDRALDQQVLYGRPYDETMVNANNNTNILTGAGNLQNNSGSAIGAVGLDEIDLLARIIGLEAGGEGREGMIAVAEVIRNRMHSGKFPSTIAGVVSQPGQFEPYYKVGSYTPTAEQLQIAKEVMEDGLSILNDPNCLYFCSRDYYESTGKFGWWGSMQMIADYGNCFFIP